MNRRLTSLLGIAIALAALAGCSKVQEPWVPSKDYLKAERERSPEEQQQLRERALYNQVDRMGDIRQMNRTS